MHSPRFMKHALGQRRWVAALAAVVCWTAFLGTASADRRLLTPRELYRTYAKSVVLVFATDGSAQGSAGTGSIITEEGDIITNAHVVTRNGEPYRNIYVYMKPKRLTGSTQRDLKHRFRASLMAYDRELDLALLHMVKPPVNLTVIDFVSPVDVEVGEPVVAIGHPETGGLWTLTTGTISTVLADFQNTPGKNMFQTDASVNRGNSGGPLLNAYGHMVGINTSISRRASDGLTITDVNFSLQSSVAVEWLKRRDVLHLAYAKIPDRPMLAMADDPATRPPKPRIASSAQEPKPAAPNAKLVEKPKENKEEVVVVEPDPGQEVADDPEFRRAVEQAWVASRGMKSGEDAPAGKKKAARSSADVKPKLLTKTRPYKLEPFVEDRIREIRALEDMMDDMRGMIEQSRRRSDRRYP